MAQRGRGRSGKGSRQRRGLERINANAAGIDVGCNEHYVAVPPGRDAEGQDVRSFRGFTCDLGQLAEWLRLCRVTTVAMESTGVYWIPLYDLLESKGFEVLLVDPRGLKRAPGRKSDVLDCQWLQELHTFGLLAGAFRPKEQAAALRAYARQRAMLVAYASDHIQHMQKALTQMNVKLRSVITDITGVTGLAIIQNADGKFERDERGRLIAVRQLARSGSNLPYFITNGNTPGKCGDFHTAIPDFPVDVEICCVTFHGCRKGQNDLPYTA